MINSWNWKSTLKEKLFNLCLVISDIEEIIIFKKRFYEHVDVLKITLFRSV